MPCALCGDLAPIALAGPSAGLCARCLWTAAPVRSAPARCGFCLRVRDVLAGSAVPICAPCLEAARCDRPGTR